jgi:hypothetical protein
MVGHLVLIEHPQGQFGAVGRSSQWRHFIEAFRWDLRGDELRLQFPQDRVEARVHARTWRCSGDAPRPFELCLEVRSGDRSRTFYSRDDWKIRPHDADALEAVTQEVPALGDALPAGAWPADAGADAEQDEGWSAADLLDRI